MDAKARHAAECRALDDEALDRLIDVTDPRHGEVPEALFQAALSEAFRRRDERAAARAEPPMDTKEILDAVFEAGRPPRTELEAEVDWMRDQRTEAAARAVQ